MDGVPADAAVPPASALPDAGDRGSRPRWVPRPGWPVRRLRSRKDPVSSSYEPLFPDHSPFLDALHVTEASAAAFGATGGGRLSPPPHTTAGDANPPPNDGAVPPIGWLPPWAVVRSRAAAVPAAGVDVELVVPLRWTPRGLLVRPAAVGTGSGCRDAVGAAWCVTPDRVVVMGPPPVSSCVSANASWLGAAPGAPAGDGWEPPLGRDRVCRADYGTAERVGSNPLGRTRSRVDGGWDRHVAARLVAADAAALQHQHSEPLVASTATRTWMAATVTGGGPGAGFLTAGGSMTAPRPPPAAGVPVTGYPLPPHGNASAPLLSWHPGGALGASATDVSPSPSRSARHVVEFVSELPRAGARSAVAFSLLGILNSSVTIVDGVASLHLRWATLRWGAAPAAAAPDASAAGGAPSTTAVVDVVDVGARLVGAHPGWAMEEVAPRPVSGEVVVARRNPEVALAAGPSGISVARGARREVTTVRPPWAMVAAPAAGALRHEAGWRWELTALDDGSPYYAGRRSPVGWRPRAAVAAAQSYAAPVGALHATWRIAAADVDAPAVAVEVSARPRVVRWPGGVGRTVRLMLSRSEMQANAETVYTDLFTIQLPSGRTD